jgi:Zn-dependent peptidase ImmA (M78 family)
MTADEIIRLAEEAAKKYNPGSIAPFPYENLVAAHPDLEIYFTDLEDDAVSGVSLFESNKYTILVNSSKPETRQHFTLGHELGHYFLHKTVLQKEKGIIDGDAFLDGPNMLYRQDTAAKTQLELDANTFAASLLMPEDLLRRAWKAFGSIQECARIFRVSVVAMSLRLTKLGLIQE